MRKPLDFALGTAMWGWNVPKETAFEMLDCFYENGYREIDAATNYPINKDATTYRLSEKILSEWIKANRVSDLKVIQKIGSINNQKTPDINLNQSFLMLMTDEYLRLFSENLSCLMIHWDNRNNKDLIENTFAAFGYFIKNGLKIGLSGIKFPEVYAGINSRYNHEFIIEVKHNQVQSDLARYQTFLNKNHRFLAYGINAGGLKLPNETGGEKASFELRGGKNELAEQLFARLKNVPEKWTMNQLGLAFAAQTVDIHGVILGCSSVGQLRESLEFGKTAHLHPPISFS